MIGQRLVANHLLRILQTAREPIYVLDRDRRIVFCNAACAAWIGVPAEQLLGQVCCYGVDPLAPHAAQAAAALCPSPTVLAAGRGTLSLMSPPNGVPTDLAFDCLPLHDDGGESCGVLLVANSRETVPPGVDALTPTYSLHRRLQQFRHEIGGRLATPRLVGDSPQMRRVRAQMAVAGSSAANVVIAGPPGSGRQQVARAIHAAGGGIVPGRLVPLACRMLGPELVRTTLSALAAARHESVDERPGTVLVEDADSLTPELQQLLGEWLLTGGSWLRAIATSRRPLADLARDGECRPDLAAALGTLTIELPGLNERLGDLLVLAQAIVEELNLTSPKQLAGFTSEALDRLAAFPWSRSVDELDEVVRQAYAQAAGPEITLADLPERLHLAADAMAYRRVPDERIVLPDYMAKVEEELIVRAMRRAKGNKSMASKLLGMSRNKLYRRLVQLGLAGPEDILLDESSEDSTEM